MLLFNLRLSLQKWLKEMLRVLIWVVGLWRFLCYTSYHTSVNFILENNITWKLQAIGRWREEDGTLEQQSNSAQGPSWNRLLSRPPHLLHSFLRVSADYGSSAESQSLRFKEQREPISADCHCAVKKPKLQDNGSAPHANTKLTSTVRYMHWVPDSHHKVTKHILLNMGNRKCP